MDLSKDISRGVERNPIGLAPHIDHHDINDYVYVRKAVPSRRSKIEGFEIKLEGCSCTTNTGDSDECCTSGTCQCLNEHNCVYDWKGMLVNVDPYLETMAPIYECNRFCKCPKTCKTRVVQNGITCNLEVFQTDEKGLGLRTLSNLSKGQFVCEYAGEIISEKLARCRLESLRPCDCNYILVLREYISDGKKLCTYVDPTVLGNVGRFTNHSCDPNLFMVPVRIDNNVPRLALFALRSISVGEELSYDYSGNIQSSSTKEETLDPLIIEEDIETIELDNDVREDQHATSATNKYCKCGSKNCRGFLPVDETLL